MSLAVDPSDVALAGLFFMILTFEVRRERRITRLEDRLDLIMAKMKIRLPPKDA